MRPQILGKQRYVTMMLRGNRAELTLKRLCRTLCTRCGCPEHGQQKAADYLPNR
jgi:hypothetical protein